MLRVAIPNLDPISVEAMLRVIESLGAGGSSAVLWVLMDERPVTAVDQGRRCLWQATDVGLPRHRVAQERVEALSPEARVEIRAGLDHSDAARGLFLDGCDLVVLSAELVEPTRLWAQHRSVFSFDVPAFPVLALGDAGWAGPLSRRGLGPCLGCAVERVRAATGQDPLVPALPSPSVIEALVEVTVEALLAAVAHGRLPEGDGLLYVDGDGRVRHPVLQVPHCPECGAGGPFMRYRFAVPPALDEAPALDPKRGILTVAERLIGPLTGPVIEASPVVEGAEDLTLEVWGASVAEPGPKGPTRVSGGAVGLDREAAQAAMLGEALERAASARICPQDGFVASYAELGDMAVDPRRFDCFHARTRAEADFPFSPFDPERPLMWVWGHALDVDGALRPKAVPAAYVATFRDPRDQIDFAVVSGFATATSYAEAAWRGFREVVERDAFNIAWANRLPLHGLRLGDSAPESVRRSREIFDAAGLQVRAATVELDLGCKLVVALCRSEKVGDPASVIAAAADPELERATARALQEVAAAMVYVRSEMAAADGCLPQPEPDQVRTMGAHGLLYARREMRHELEAWWEPATWVEIPAAAAAPPPLELLKRGVRLASAAGLQVLVVDLTPPAIHDIGLRVVKTLVPGAYPMLFDSRFPPFGGERLTEVPVRAGLLPRRLDFDELRRVPHPFP